MLIGKHFLKSLLINLKSLNLKLTINLKKTYWVSVTLDPHSLESVFHNYQRSLDSKEPFTLLGYIQDLKYIQSTTAEWIQCRRGLFWMATPCATLFSKTCWRLQESAQKLQICFFLSSPEWSVNNFSMHTRVHFLLGLIQGQPADQIEILINVCIAKHFLNKYFVKYILSFLNVIYKAAAEVYSLL